MNKTMVITGAGEVLCSVLAKSLAKEDYKIAALDLNEKTAQITADAIKAEGGTAIGVRANVLEKAKKKINDQLGGCDVLINGAGVNHPKETTSGTPPDQRRPGRKE